MSHWGSSHRWVVTSHDYARFYYAGKQFYYDYACNYAGKQGYSGSNSGIADLETVTCMFHHGLTEHSWVPSYQQGSTCTAKGEEV